MTRWRTLDQQTVRDLLTRLRGLDWGWTAAEVPDVARRLGWTIIADLPGAGAAADAGLGLGGQEATFVYRGDDVDRLKIDATGNTGAETPQAQAFVHDAFADLVATATDLYGPPDRTVHDGYPRALWQDDRTTLTITGGGVAVLVTLKPNERQQYWDRVEATQA